LGWESVSAASSSFIPLYRFVARSLLRERRETAQGPVDLDAVSEGGDKDDESASLMTRVLLKRFVPS
jgi:hypothetical protein